MCKNYGFLGKLQDEKLQAELQTWAKEQNSDLT